MLYKISLGIGALLGLGLLFLGARFFISPELAEVQYGLQFAEQGDYAFHSIKGARDLFVGILFCALLLLKEYRALGIGLLVGTLIPTVDLIVVLSKEYNTFAPAVSHLIAALLCFLAGMYILFTHNQRIRR